MTMLRADPRGARRAAPPTRRRTCRLRAMLRGQPLAGDSARRDRRDRDADSCRAAARRRPIAAAVDREPARPTPAGASRRRRRRRRRSAVTLQVGPTPIRRAIADRPGADRRFGARAKRSSASVRRRLARNVRPVCTQNRGSPGRCSMKRRSAPARLWRARATCPGSTSGCDTLALVRAIFRPASPCRRCRASIDQIAARAPAMITVSPPTTISSAAGRRLIVDADAARRRRPHHLRRQRRDRRQLRLLRQRRRRLLLRRRRRRPDPRPGRRRHADAAAAAPTSSSIAGAGEFDRRRLTTRSPISIRPPTGSTCPAAVRGFAAAVDRRHALRPPASTPISRAALGGLGAGQAVWFAPDAGDLAGTIFLVVDGNGVAGYQAGEDYVFAIGGAPLADLTGAYRHLHLGSAGLVHPHRDLGEAFRLDQQAVVDRALRACARGR